MFSEGGTFRLRFETAGGRSNIDAALPPTGEWVHVAVTNDAAEAKIFINGAEAGTGPVAGKLNANEDPLRIAQDCERPQYIFAGAIDEARLWNRALTVDEIAKFKDQGKEAIAAVEPIDKLPTVWGEIKAQY